MQHKESDTADMVFSDLCASVDYWKRRALEAEATLQQEREDAIKAAGLWSEFSHILNYFGPPPARTKPQSIR